MTLTIVERGKKLLQIRDYFIVHIALRGGAENDGHEIAGHEIDGPSCRA